LRKVQSGKRMRLSYGRLLSPMKIPDLLGVQRKSYEYFLKNGIREMLDKFSPVETVRKNTRRQGKHDFILEFTDYKLGEAPHSEEECKQKNLSYSVPLMVTIRVTDKITGEMKEEEAFFGYLPLMTKRCTFIINGAERVVVNQLVRSPGLYFLEEESAKKDRTVYKAHFLPVRGAWLEIFLDITNMKMEVNIDRRRKVKLLLFLKFLGYESPGEIANLFPKKIDITSEEKEEYVGRILTKAILDGDGDLVYDAGEILTTQKINTIFEKNVKEIWIVDPIIQNIMESSSEDELKMTRDDACIDIYRRLRPGDIPKLKIAKAYLNGLYFGPEKYNMGEIGRYKINQKLGFGEDREETFLTKEDIIGSIRYLLHLPDEPRKVDEKDHLANKRVRSVGELMREQFEEGLVKVVKIIEDRLQSYASLDKINVQTLVNVKPIMAIINAFFRRGQLSQFLDQTNPLAELTNKRRLSALGPGGLKHKRGGFGVRDVHHSQYGRICPIESPEGPNIGLITSLAIYARLDNYGFIRTPYRKVQDGYVTDEVVYLTAAEEENFYIAQANAPFDENGKLKNERVAIRHGEDVIHVKREQVDYMDVSPKQIVSVSTSLIPFLEHDDANRALMGSNMQRQAVPLLRSEAPFVGTGMESIAARDSGMIVLAENAGIVEKVSADEILIKRDSDGSIDTYKLVKFTRSNQNTVLNQIPIVDVGEHVNRGEPIADGPSTNMGELALGRNVLVAFMPWEGYNFQDATLISERLLEDDIFTSIHIEVYETFTRETKLGPEEITADIPNISREQLRNLDEDGIIRIGAFVKSQDILVGKVTPKGEREQTPEQRIMKSIFGDHGRDVKDTSLRMPHGTFGRVVDVKVYDREEINDMAPGILKMIKVYVASRKVIAIGDKISGRHGNKGVISNILPVEDMPFLPDGEAVDIILNPLGVPSRMNLGQVLETHLGWVAKLSNEYISTPIFDGAREDEILHRLYELRKQNGLISFDTQEEKNGKVYLRDGRTGKYFDHPVVVGYMYILKLTHIAQDKIHARSTGPYSLVHQQPLSGKAQFGGQRLGEMEVWALEAYGAANTLQEMLTIKSDDMEGRKRAYRALLTGKNVPQGGMPESFKSLIKLLQSLALDIRVYDANGKEISTDVY